MSLEHSPARQHRVPSEHQERDQRACTRRTASVMFFAPLSFSSILSRYFAIIREGRDPAAEERRKAATERRLPSVVAFAREYIERHAKPNKRGNDPFRGHGVDLVPGCAAHLRHARRTPLCARPRAQSCAGVAEGADARLGPKLVAHDPALLAADEDAQIELRRAVILDVAEGSAPSWRSFSTAFAVSFMFDGPVRTSRMTG
jgi:hypothetical protein